MGEIVSTSEIPAVFDRRRTQHRWLRAFEELELYPSTRRFVCKNWRMDHRVSEDREGEILDAPEFDGEPDGEEWWRQRGEHFYRALCQPAAPNTSGHRAAYVSPTNSGNAIPRRTLPSHEQLVHVGSLDRILQRLTSGEHLAVNLRLRFHDLTGRDLPRRALGEPFDIQTFRRQVDGAAEGANSRGPEVVRQLAGLLCDGLGDTEPPWWACFAEEVATLIEQQYGAGLCRALGLGHLEDGEWLVVWRYEVGQIYLTSPDDRIFRPTVVEGNDNPFHFPSPPGCRYGITMPLDPSRRGACREVVHPPLRGKAAADGCTGAFVKLRHLGIYYNEISDLRRRHRRNLEDTYPERETAEWLGRHPPRDPENPPLPL